jgi:hypothetical protein
MDTNASFASALHGSNWDESRTIIGARLKKLRRERRLIERAIAALTEVSQTRQSRSWRALGGHMHD